MAMLRCKWSTWVRAFSVASVFVLVSFVQATLFQQPACGADNEWILTINTKTLDKCLDYPDSKLKPIIKSSVKFEQSAPEKDPDFKDAPDETDEQDQPITAIPQTAYEDLFYSKGQILGLKRYNQLRVRPGTPGFIRVAAGASINRMDEASAAANTVVRMFFDLYKQKAPLRYVLVSRDFFDTVVMELQRYGFRPASVVPGQPVMALVMMHLRSEPPGRTQDMSYGF